MARGLALAVARAARNQESIMTAAEEAKEQARKGASQPPPSGAHNHSSSDAGGGADSPPDPFGAEIERALADVKMALGTMPGAKRSCLFGTDGADLLSEAFPDPQWQVTGLFTRPGTVMIGGLPKAVKTWLATEIAISIATGTKVCGKFYAEAGRAVYFYAEDTKRQVRNRIRALLAGADRRLPPGRLHLQPRGEFLDVTRDEDLALIVASCRKLGSIDVLILDPLRDLHSNAENEADGMAPVMKRLRAVGEVLGCTVVLVHHMGKPGESTGRRSGGQRMRGSNVVHGSADSGIYFNDSEKNGEDEFTSYIESEVKGARSAGFFTLELKIEDDANGEAVRAVWAYSKEEGADKEQAKPESKEERKRKEEEEEERTAFDFIRSLAMRGESLTRQGLRDHDENPLTDRRMYYAACRLVKKGRCRLGRGGVVHIPPPRASSVSGEI